MEEEQLVVGKWYSVWHKSSKKNLPARLVHKQRNPYFEYLVEYLPTISNGHMGKMCKEFHLYQHLLRKKDNCRWVERVYIGKELKEKDLIWEML